MAWLLILYLISGSGTVEVRVLAAPTEAACRAGVQVALAAGIPAECEART